MIRIAQAISRAGAIVGGALLLAAALTICVDIFLRYAFSLTVGGADELSGYALGIASAWGLTAALLSRSHIRIDTFYVRIRSRRVRATLDLLSLATFITFIALVAWHAWGMVQLSYVSGSRSQSAIEAPLVVPQGLWFSGLAFFVVVALLLFIRALVVYVRGDPAAVAVLIGSKSAAAEAQEEIDSAERALEGEPRQ